MNLRASSIDQVAPIDAVGRGLSLGSPSVFHLPAL